MTKLPVDMGLLDADGTALRIWVLITGLAGLSAAVGAYLDPLSPYKTLYHGTTTTATPPFAHMYGTWLFTSTMIRIAFCVAKTRTIQSEIFWLVFGTYCIAAAHFLSEIFVFRSATLRPGGFAPLIVAGSSIMWFSLIVLLA